MLPNQLPQQAALAAALRGPQGAPQMPMMPPQAMGAMPPQTFAPQMNPAGRTMPPQVPPQVMGGLPPAPNAMALQNANPNARFNRPAAPTLPQMPPQMGRGRR